MASIKTYAELFMQGGLAARRANLGSTQLAGTLHVFTFFRLMTPYLGWRALPLKGRFSLDMTLTRAASSVFLQYLHITLRPLLAKDSPGAISRLVFGRA